MAAVKMSGLGEGAGGGETRGRANEEGCRVPIDDLSTAATSRIEHRICH